MHKPLTHGYKNSAKWWAAVDLFRRFIMILVIAVFPGRTVSQLNIFVFVHVLLYVQLYKHMSYFGYFIFFMTFYVLNHSI